MRVQREGDLLSGGDSSGKEAHNVRAGGKRITTALTLSTGQNGFNPSLPAESLPTVRINGVPIVLEGYAYAPHTNGVTVQTETALGGDANVVAG